MRSSGPHCISIASSKTLSQSHCISSYFSLIRVEEYIESGRDEDVIDPDPNNLYTRRKEQQSSSSVPFDSDQQRHVKFPESSWSTSLEKMPMFTRAEMNSHVEKSGKTIGNQAHHSVPTGMRKAKTFLDDEYLHDIEATSDHRYFYFRATAFVRMTHHIH